MLQKIFGFIFLFFLILLPVLSTGLLQECYNVNTTTHRIVDKYGREVYFHGINVVVKGPPWIPRTDAFHPTSSFVDKDMEMLQELGLNAVRFGMMWPGAEPVKDQYNETYFNIAKAIVKKAGTYNISILLDMHQDVMSPRFCGEGIPDWTVDSSVAKSFPEPLSKAYDIDPSTGYPSKEDCAKHEWGTYYLTEATSASFQRIYDNEDGLLDKLAEFWAKVASEFKDYENILGYEIINEPWAGNIYSDPFLLWPQVADKNNLAHVYDIVGNAIWNVDSCHNVFFESVTWDEWTVGFESVPGGSENGHRSVLSYHFYVPPDVDSEVSIGFRMDDVKKLQCGSFMTEFSLTSTDTSHVMDEADKFLQSWTGWDYKPYYGITGDSSSLWLSNGSMNTQMASVISRTYAQAVAGFTKTMIYDSETHLFKLSYIITSSCMSSITEIYLNEDLHYPNGYTVSITPHDVAKWTRSAKNHITIVHDSTTPLNTLIEVEIK